MPRKRYPMDEVPSPIPSDAPSSVERRRAAWGLPWPFPKVRNTDIELPDDTRPSDIDDNINEILRARTHFGKKAPKFKDR